jgi:hypothetical protein
VHIGQLHGDRESLQRRGMTTLAIKRRSALIINRAR